MSKDRTSRPRVSIVVISLTGSGPTLDCLRRIGIEKTEEYEIIVVSHIRNASKARNLGVARARGEIMVLLDDDVEFTGEGIYLLVSKAERGRIIGSEASRVMYRDDYVRAGGFDERVFMVYMEDVEFRRRTERYGLIGGLQNKKYDYSHVVKHLGGKPSWRKLLLLKFNAPLVFLQYRNVKEFLKNLTSYPGLHPLRFLVTLALPLGFFYYLPKLKFWRRSIFSAK